MPDDPGHRPEATAVAVHRACVPVAAELACLKSWAEAGLACRTHS